MAEAREAAGTRKDDASLPASDSAEDIERIEGEATPPEIAGVSKLRRGRASVRAKWHRLGPLDYTLLVLVVLGIAVTIVMAIFNPSS